KSFYFMDLLEGETIGKKVLRFFSEEDRRKKFLSQIGKALARIHTIRPDTHDLSFLPKLAGEEHPALATVRVLEKFLDSTSFEPHPAIELGLRWVRNNLRPVPKPTLVHGDFRIGNLLVNEEGLKGVLDWELSHVGDPMEDLAWIGVRFWRFGGEKPVGGLFEWKEFFSAYEAAGGFPVDPKAVRVWEVLRNLWWAVGTLQQADRHLSGSQRNLELASLGRRCCEMEYEALQLIAQEEGYYPF
ncbi:MAG: phosphotransferase family protein, partial [Bdellovibrionota bacterium]